MDDAVRVVVFTGSGRAFCAGDHMGGYAEHAPASVAKIGRGHTTGIGTANALRVYSQGLNLAVRNLDKITIAAINGHAIQTGLSLALCCDFRIGSTAAKLGSATLRFALLPDEGGQYLLVQHLGLAKALDFCLRKRIVSADEALSLGLLNEVVEPDALMPVAMALATELAQGPQVAMRMLKRSLYNATESSSPSRWTTSPCAQPSPITTPTLATAAAPSARSAPRYSTSGWKAATATGADAGSAWPPRRFWHKKFWVHREFSRMSETQVAAKPLPVVGFLKIPESGEPYLEGYRCEACGEIFLGQRMVCAACGDARHDERRASSPTRASSTISPSCTGTSRACRCRSSRRSSIWTAAAR